MDDGLLLVDKFKEYKHAVVLVKGAVKVGKLVTLTTGAPSPTLGLGLIAISLQVVGAVGKVLDCMAQTQADFIIIGIWN